MCSKRSTFVLAMKKYGLQSAGYIKCLFIDYLLSRSKELIIGNELMYGIKRKVVDLVVLQNKKIIAVEIKSDSDNLSRLEEQISERPERSPRYVGRQIGKFFFPDGRPD